MSGRGRYEDLSTLFYMVPFLLSGVYGLVLWVQGGISPFLPASVYLTVTRDPWVFVVGSGFVLLGIMIEVNSTEPPMRQAKLASLGMYLQMIAVASLVLVLVSALYANGFTNLSGMATDFIIGRYGLVFPATMVLLSYLLTAQFEFSSLRNPKVLAVIAMLLVPASLYEIGKRQLTLGLVIACLLLIFGLGAYLFPERKATPAKQE